VMISGSGVGLTISDFVRLNLDHPVLL
jgi:hypothetical protein